MQEEKCCVVTCDNPIDQNYWNQQYASNTTGWDLGEVAPAIKRYIDQLPSKTISILIPGCGNAHEAAYLMDQGFTNVTVIDIAPLLVEKLQEKFEGNDRIKIVPGDFFDHQGQYDLIIEQTFFCALPPFMRQRYANKMYRLLNNNGILSGLLFDREFEDGPPFGGSRAEYENLFKAAFTFNRVEPCQESVDKRAGNELFIELQKDDSINVALYAIDGITCSNCSKTIVGQFMTVEGVLNCSISTDFKELLLVSSREIPIESLRQILAYDKKYLIETKN